MIYKIMIALILFCLWLSALLYWQISQDHCKSDGYLVWQFVVGETSKYCYIRWQEPKHLQVYANFDTIEWCEEFLHLYR